MSVQAHIAELETGRGGHRWQGVVHKIAAAALNVYTTCPMYVRWQSRKRRSKWGEGTPRWVLHWRAVLVESKRVGGKPKQVHVAYLAGFVRHALKHPSQRVWLWERIEDHLMRVIASRCGLLNSSSGPKNSAYGFIRPGNRISSGDRSRIVAMLAKKAGEIDFQAEARTTWPVRNSK